MSTQTEARILLNQLEGLRKATDKNILAHHLQFILWVYLAGDGGTSHDELVHKGMAPSVVSRLMQDFSKVGYDKLKVGYDMLTVEHDPTNLRRKIIRINARGQKTLDRILSR